MNDICQSYKDELQRLEASGNLRKLPSVVHDGKWVIDGGRKMLNLSSNDYLGLSTDKALRQEFISNRMTEECLFSSSSSRLLTGNYTIYDRLETLLADLFGAESALVFCSGYHMNTGILPAVTDSTTLILADKLVHASIIDGIRLSQAQCVRYRHQDYKQLEMLLQKHKDNFSRIIIVTESIFSMDGDIAPLYKLVELKKMYPNVMLYVDEAHAIGVRGDNGLGIAEEQGCIHDIDFLCGTFGKALSSVGAYVICRKAIREFLVNRMRTLIFTTALPPVNVAWTYFIVEHLSQMKERRNALNLVSSRLRDALRVKDYDVASESHIVPMIVGKSSDTILKAEEMQRKGFYVLPVRPPTVPEGTSRLRFSLTAAVSEEEVGRLIEVL